MQQQRNSEEYVRPVRRLVVAVLVLACLALFTIWRIDNPRVEALRMRMTDLLAPAFEQALLPATHFVALLRDYQSYENLYARNQELQRELRRLKVWREAALQLEQENARLLALNNVKLNPRLTWITGKVIADSGTAFRQSVILNLGRQDGITDGWPAMDGLGLAGRIAGVGQRSSRVLLLTDTASKVPVEIQPSGQNGLVAGDNLAFPRLDFVAAPEFVRPGDRVITSGDGGVFPPGLLVGQIARDSSGQLRVRLAADLRQLSFLRILRDRKTVEEMTSSLIVTSLDHGASPSDCLADADVGCPTPDADD